MKNKSSLPNSLIKRKNLANIFNNLGIKRISPKAYTEFEKQINLEVTEISKVLAQKIIIKGKRTLEGKDVDEAFSERKGKNYPEF